jgi:DNA primase
MRDATGRVIGIRRRFPDGTKRALRRSKNGLFVPSRLTDDDWLLICEGESDTASALDLGFNAVGRPGCLGGGDLLEIYCRCRDVVIVADGDGPGLDGAERLATRLRLFCPDVRVIIPPVKDLRAWRQAGATQADLELAIESAQGAELVMA